MLEEIDKDSDSLAVKAFMDWVFGAEEAKAPEGSPAAADEEEEEEDDVEDELDEPPPPQKTGARSSVSAEAYGAWNVKKAFTPPKYEKTEDQKKRIKDVLSKSFLFQSV